MKSAGFNKAVFFFFSMGMLAAAVLAGDVFAHCDTLNGPIIPEARAALEKGDATPILKWVQPMYEGEIQKAFTRAVAARTRSPEAKEVADLYFLETLIRLHRMGEGAPFMGLKDEPVEPVVALAEKALSDGSAGGMLEALNTHMDQAVREKFDKVQAAAKHKDQSIAAGREFVEAYVAYMHFVEGIHNAILADPGHHQAAMATETKAAQPKDNHKH